MQRGLRGVALVSASTLAVVALATCHPALNLGNDVIWSADFETGSLSQWIDGAPPGAVGGYYVADSGPSAPHFNVPKGSVAHSGHYAAYFTSIAGTQPTSRFPTGGGSLFLQGPFPPETYYSAWYYIPVPDGGGSYLAMADWAILRFLVPPIGSADPDGAAGEASADGGDSGASGAVDSGADTARPSNLLSLNLHSAHPPDLTLVLFDSRREYLESPLPTPVPVIRLGRWFQVECFYRNVSDAGGGGEFIVWLDGVLIYDVHRPFGFNPVVYFAPGSVVDYLTPTEARLYIDDVAVSWSRVGPNGRIEVSP